jgi:hypothetical protein
VKFKKTPDTYVVGCYEEGPRQDVHQSQKEKQNVDDPIDIFRFVFAWSFYNSKNNLELDALSTTYRERVLVCCPSQREDFSG